MSRLRQGPGRLTVTLSAVAIGVCLILTFQNCSGFNSPVHMMAQGGNANNSSNSPNNGGSTTETGLPQTALYSGATWNTLSQTMTPNGLLIDSNGTVYVQTATCGIFSSTDGQSFSPVSLPGVYDTPSKIYVDNGTIYLATVVGLFRKRPSDSLFMNILNIPIENAILQQAAPPCSSVGLGTSQAITAVYASGNNIVVNDSGLTFYSADGAQTWNLSSLMEGSKYLPSMSASTIYSAGGTLYMTNGQGNLISNGSSSSTCAGGASSTDYGVLTSTDNGKTFQAIADAGNLSIAAVANGNDIYSVSYVASGSGLIASHDAGATFSNILVPTNMYVGGAFNMLALSGSNLFVTKNVYRATQALLKSTDGGNSFSTLNLPTSSANYYVISLAANASKLFVLTDEGLFISSDLGATFTQKKFSSQFCAYPPWVGGPLKMTGSGNYVYSLQYGGVLLFSSDSGNTFTFQTMANPKINETSMWASGNNLYLGANGDATTSTGSIVVTGDQGATYSAPSSFVVDSLSGFGLGVIPGQIGDFYFSLDGVNHLSELPAGLSGPTTAITNVISFGDKLIVDNFNGGTPLAEVVENGSIVSQSSIGNNGNGGSLVYFGGKIFQLGYSLMVSTDQGTTFTPVPNTPHFSTALFPVGSDLWLLSQGGLYISGDGGVTFARYQGQLN